MSKKGQKIVKTALYPNVVYFDYLLWVTFSCTACCMSTSSEFILKIEFTPQLIIFNVFPPLSLCPSVCSIHSWRWPSLCPASLRSSWQPRTPWGATAKSQSLKTINVNAIDSRTSHHHLTGLRMTTISDLLKESQTASPLFSSVSVLMPDVPPLCLVLKLHTAMMCSPFLAARARVCVLLMMHTGCYSVHHQECHRCKGSRLFAHQRP